MIRLWVKGKSNWLNILYKKVDILDYKLPHKMKKQSRSVSKLLEMAIKRYQFDVVGWIKYCTDNKNKEQKGSIRFGSMDYFKGSSFNRQSCSQPIMVYVFWKRFSRHAGRFWRTRPTTYTSGIVGLACSPVYKPGLGHESFVKGNYVVCYISTIFPY